MNSRRWLTSIVLIFGPLLALSAMQQSKDAARPQVGGPQAKVTNPHGPLSTPCQNCHTYTSWKPIRSNPEFNHDQTGYPLRGMHQKVACTLCHTNLVFKNVSTRCADCHADIHRRQFGANCESCHSVKGWQVSVNAIRNHDNRFPLIGAHATVQCDQCHTNSAAGQFQGLSTECISCHEADFKTKVIDHVSLHFSTKCETCHTMDTWFNARFDHLQYTGYALTGMHATLPCSSCHTSGNFATGTPTDCFTCHINDFTKSDNPPHAQLGLPHDCATCHTTSDWLNAKFDHALYAHYPLTGGHANVACAQCHTNNNYRSTPTDCFACHAKDYNGATNPNHASLGFPTNCTLCHTVTVWTNSTFNHNTTSFPLTGAHTTLQCAQCHVNNNYTTLPTTCYGCHQADFTGTTNPGHVSAGFPTDCTVCHSTSNWNSTFDHSKTAFPLTGAHTTVQCALCHVNNNYTTLPTSCYGCHQKDFTGTTSPAHVAGGFPTDCTMCHTTSAWQPSTFDHSAVFPLTGAHATTQCAQCHVNNNYTTLPTTCYGCHQKDFTGTTSPAHVPAGFPTDCTVCHTTSNWNSTFDHSKTAFPLTGAHTTVQCAQCHVNNNYTTLPTTCYGCHQKDFTGTTNPAHVAGGFPTDCTVCHSTANWNSTFNHNNTPFPLTGAHTTVACASCHVNNNYTTLPTACYGCHQADYTSTNNPSHTAVGFPTTCQTCHSTTNWTTATFDHNTTSFPLTGAHTTVPCAQCHVNNNYTTLPTACYGCHQKDFTGTTSPAHVAAGFPTDCTVCHSTSNWNSTFDHSKTAFPLTGAHVTVACASCHVNNNYTTLPTACYGCHQKDYTSTNNPSHTAVGFPTTCQTCHNTTNWTTATFDHNTTSFPLTGAHTTVPCAQCHVNNNYTTLPTACYGCHQKDFTGTTSPAHVAAGFPTDCTVCHSTANWNSTFNHNNTPFPLTGAHTTVACASCHVNNNYTTLPTACYGCHQKDFTGTTNPAHVAAGFPTDCTVCHSTAAWSPSTFNHSSVFPLTGAHATTACASCHVNNNYTTLPTTCYGCHQKDYASTNNPPHATVGFPTTCATCHNTTDWTLATFDHSTTSFPLTGAHTTVACTTCHVNNNYTTLPTACYGCHQKDFTGTTSPAHVAAGFPTDCTVCHSTANWNSTFNHNNTPFPLTGAHTTVACASCHVNNNYTTLPTACYGCHQADYTSTNSPPHATVGFPTTCQTCHSTTNWTTATFDHNTTSFPLTGAHTTVACATCHVNNNYTTLPTACYGCHQKDFTGTTSPAHVAAGFPTDCTVCHSTANWNSTFNHNNTPFPLTGAHTTVACATCHVNNNYTTLPTACYGCHQADYTSTNSPPHATVGFPTTCQTCHSTTNWTTATFDHNTTSFPLTGAHTTVACATCHVNNNYTTLPTTCYGCHQKDFTGTTSPAHVSSGFPTDCTLCHTTTAWQPSSFNHASVFPLTGVHATITCAQCHVNNNYTTLPTACYGCHQADYTSTNSPPHATVGFPTTCQTCHSTTNWTSATFDHSTTSFPLTGAHTTVACATCHVNNNYTTLPTTCYGCHQKDFTGTTSPAHVAAGFPTDCTVCHTTANWNSTFNHNNTPFPLTGAHTTVACASCHVNNNYTTLPTACYGCHQADYTSTNSPPHATVGFPTTCATCHSTTNWTSATFDHSTTSFPLTGAHTTVACATCHVNNNYTTLPTTCYGCHQKDFTGTTSPAHVAAGFPTDCTVCHTTANWTSTFNHNNTTFPLTGAHTTVACASCHVNNNYTTLPTTCYGCHQADFTGTTSPAHVAAGFPTDCTICHTTSNWNSTFNHNNTPFPLTGAHTTVACASCHVNNNYTTLPTTCYGCHQTDWTNTNNPSHSSAGFPTTCDTCHSTTNWTTVTFNHATYANYPLTGAHATLTCVQCHVNNSYTNTPTACYSCHQADFNGTTNPNHVTSGFPTDCSICHTTAAWSPSSFDHNTTAFPLTGAHITVACASCHVNNNYTTLPTACYGCHQSDWTGTTNPNHAAAGFPTTCDTCHTTTSWAGATFNHNNTPFPLTGAHVNVACNQCHVNNVFAGTPTDCYSCHQADWTGTTNPNHAATGWPTTCTTCHTTTAWLPATLPTSYHTFFPVNHGNANGVCTTCHTNSSDYSVFTCTGCHTAAKTNPEHSGVSGYVYNSVNCLACHKNGGGG